MIKKSQFITVYILLALVGLYIILHSDVTVPMNRNFSEFPVMLKGWQMVSQGQLSQGVIDVLKPTDYLSRTYAANDGGTVSLYIGYHGGGRDAGEIHSPKHCLPGSGWQVVSEKKNRVDVNGNPVNIVEAVYQKGDERELFLYWFQVKNKSLTDEYNLKLSELVNSMLYRRRDASFVRISVPSQKDPGQDVALGKSFIKDFYPVIAEFLPG